MKTILLIEDESSHAELMRRALESAEYEVVIAENLAAALDSIGRLLPALALVDGNLPDGSGSEFIAAAQGRFPVVLITSHGDEHQAVQALRLGALDYLVKSPAIFDELPHAIARSLREWSLQVDRRQMSEALVASEERYRRITEGLTDYVYSVKVENGQAVATRHGLACERVTGYNSAEFDSDPFLWLKVILPEDRDRVLAQIQRVLAGLQCPAIEHRIAHKDQTIHWVSDTPILHHDRDGRFTGYDGVIRDITEKKSAADALSRREAELFAIYENAPVIMLLLDRMGTVRRINDAGRRFSPSSTPDPIGARVGAVFSCAHARECSQGCGFSPTCTDCRLYNTANDTLQNGTTHRRVGFQLRNQDASETRSFEMLLSTARVVVNDEIMVLACLEDTTEQKRAEARVREQAELLDVTHDAVVVIDQAEAVTFWNHGAEALFGLSTLAALGHPLSTLIDSQASLPEIARAIEMLKNTGEWSGELTLEPPHRPPLVVLGRGVLMFGPSGASNSMLLSFSDITLAKQIERQYLRAQRMENLGSIAGGVAHDLNNVFTPLMISIEMLRSSASLQDQDLLRILGATVHRGAEIVRQLLIFGRGDDSPREDLAIGPEILSLHRLMRETFPKNIVNEVEIRDDLWTVLANRTQIHQILMNLCVNARDAMPKGGDLCLTAENLMIDADFARKQLKGEPGPHVCIRVRDTGYGIPAHIQERIFEPFFTTKGPTNGTGLGLATALGIVNSLGGFITVTSSAGEGSEFSIYLPANTAKGGIPAVDWKEENTARGHGELILVVDDEDSIRHIIERALLTNGYAVIQAENGAVAVELLQHHGSEVRLVVTDIMMPKVDGLQLISAVGERWPHLPVIAMSGMHPSMHALNGRESPTILTLAKPFTVHKIMEAVHGALQADPGPTCS